MLGVLIALAIRCLLVGLFLPFSALDKILNFRAAIGQASLVIPSRALAVFLIASGFCIEIFMSLAILVGIADRMAAVILAGYCVITAMLWKQFWRKPDFRLRGASSGRDVFWDFLKNISLAGGFLCLAFGSNATGVRYFLHHPLASSHPYEISQEDMR